MSTSTTTSATVLTATAASAHNEHVSETGNVHR
jgi:hypothetical protein